MRKFKITAVLPNGDEVRSNVVAVSAAAAVEKIKASSQFIEFLGDMSMEDVWFLDEGSEEIKPIAIDACRLTTFEGVGCAVEHIASGVIIGFEEGRFNATAEALNYPAMMTAEQIATIMREVGEWLYVFHKRKIMTIREITKAWMAANKITNRALAAEIGTSENAFSAYIHGCRPLPYECIENLLIILQQSGQL
jgi:hypothetical protein